MPIRDHRGKTLGIASLGRGSFLAKGPDFIALMKPRVMSLAVFTAFVGLVMAPGVMPFGTALVAMVAIAFGAGAAGSLNKWYDGEIDAVMSRTSGMPGSSGRVSSGESLGFGLIVSAASVTLLAVATNVLAGALLAFTIFFYAVIYTMWLKLSTPRNIVIGGAAGAIPPVIGWAAVSGDIGLGAVVLFLIIFLWTPPHTWALALFRRGDYEAAGVPMLPVVAGERETKRQMLIYTAILIPASLLPVAFAMSGAVYGVAALALGVGLARHAWAVWKDDTGPDGGKTARPMFFFSILYLFLIFAALLAEIGRASCRERV